jgi:hypothetical protein
MKKEMDTSKLLMYSKDKDGNLSDEFLLDEEPYMSDAMENMTRKKLKEIGYSDEKIERAINIMKNY